MSLDGERRCRLSRDKLLVMLLEELKGRGSSLHTGTSMLREGFRRGAVAWQVRLRIGSWA